MQTTIVPLLRHLPRNVTVICSPQGISLNYAQSSPHGRCVAQTQIPYELADNNIRERLSQFRFRVARLRYEASHS